MVGFLLNFDYCQQEVVSDVISCMVNQDVGMDVCANFGEVEVVGGVIFGPFSNVDTSDRKYILT